MCRPSGSDGAPALPRPSWRQDTEVAAGRLRIIRAGAQTTPIVVLERLAGEPNAADGELRGVPHHADSAGVYGSPRVYAVLQREGTRVGRKRIERLMREADLAGVSPRRKGFTRRDPKAASAPDLVNRDFTAPAPNRLWVTDLTMVSTGEGRCGCPDGDALACADADDPVGAGGGQVV
ncbi:IS3 family transposase [Streptomyces fungicidicus]|uniref:IS3 family transposase n=1 Tax=Streptomyces fungicidicus TaxID=68203 RepID=UPI00340C8072